MNSFSGQLLEHFRERNFVNICRAVCRSGSKYLLENKDDILKLSRRIPDSPGDDEKTGIFDERNLKAGQ